MVGGYDTRCSLQFTSSSVKILLDASLLVLHGVIEHSLVHAYLLYWQSASICTQLASFVRFRFGLRLGLDLGYVGVRVIAKKERGSHFLYFIRESTRGHSQIR